MSKDLTVAMMLDFYSQLLTDKQRDIMDFYYNDDLSLSEIGEIFNISRQGVRDHIKRSEKQLLDFELKLGLVKRFTNIKEHVIEIEHQVDLLKKNMDISQIAKLKAMCDLLIKII